jgi:hypothetical protein
VDLGRALIGEGLRLGWSGEVDEEKGQPSFS